MSGPILQEKESKAALQIKEMVMNKSLVAALVGGIIGLANPAFAQDSGGSSSGADVTTDRVVVTRDVVVTHRVVSPAQVPFATLTPGWELANHGGGVGGAIGGYYINGTTRADNRPLPGGTWPYR
jgi:hypothetical protein